jgi:hypothetical protein
MLIQKPISNGDTITIKLLSGEEVIARFDSEDDSSFYGYGFCTLDDQQFARPYSTK